MIGIAFNERLWEGERGWKNAESTAQLLQVPQILAFSLVKFCNVKNLGVVRGRDIMSVSMAHLVKHISKPLRLLSLIVLVPSLTRLEAIA